MAEVGNCLEASAARAAADDDSNSESPSPPSHDSSSSLSDDPFESRLSSFRLRYQGGTGKKAEMRKARKGAANSPSSNLPSLSPLRSRTDPFVDLTQESYISTRERGRERDNKHKHSLSCWFGQFIFPFAEWKSEVKLKSPPPTFPLLPNAHLRYQVTSLSFPFQTHAVSPSSSFALAAAELVSISVRDSIGAVSPSGSNEHLIKILHLISVSSRADALPDGDGQVAVGEDESERIGSGKKLPR
ncbi:hypothetical protein LINPERPRIM_LOCUS27469 [Linum perenne]